MNNIEIKDLESGKQYIVVHIENNTCIPYIVKCLKLKDILFLSNNKKYTIDYFFHENRGIDFYGNRFILLNCWDSIDECNKWCEFENKIRQ